MSCGPGLNPGSNPSSRSVAIAQSREVALALEQGFYEGGANPRIRIPVSSTLNLYVAVDIRFSFENPANLPANGATVWFFKIPREYVQEFDPDGNENEPSFLAVNVTTTHRQIGPVQSEIHVLKRTPCGTITTIPPVVVHSPLITYHMINDYGNLTLVETDTIFRAWNKVVASGYVDRDWSPHKTSMRTTTNALLKYYTASLDMAWRWH
jgi:hypothetical protein